MADAVTLEFIAKQLERVLAEQADMRAELTGMRSRLDELAAGQTVLTEMVFRVERAIVQIKDALGRLDNRVTKLEDAAP
jgi:predicted nuclease with TOPRIM domain